jgi:hypothetical protein
MARSLRALLEYRGGIAIEIRVRPRRADHGGVDMEPFERMLRLRGLIENKRDRLGIVCSASKGKFN